MDDKVGMLKPRLLGAVVHSAEVGEVLHFDILHIETGGPLDKEGIGGEVGLDTPLPIYFYCCTCTFQQAPWKGVTGQV